MTEGSKPDRLDVAITVVEGPRTFVESRRVDGVEHLVSSELDALILVKEGEPFNPSAVRQDVATLTARYWNTGWREAAVRDHWTLSPDKTKVDVVYTVDEGDRSFFGKTIVRGNAVTDADRIMRQVAWKEGEPFSEEKIADTQKNLARTGVFRSIEVRPQPVNPDNQEHNIDVTLSEARRVSLLYGVGYQYANGASPSSDPFLTLGVSYRNLFGRMQSASFEAQYAPISQRGYIVANLTEPYLFNFDVPLTLAVFASREPIQDIDIERFGVFLESARQFGALRVGLRYSYQQIAPSNPQDLSTIVLEKFPRSAFPIKQSAIGPSLLYDRRDDVLNPQKGYYVTLAGNYAFPFLNADAHYGKVSGQAAWFASVFGGVLAASVRVGGLFPANAGIERDRSDRREVLRGRLVHGPRLRHGPRGHPGPAQRERLAGHRGLQHAGDAPLGNGHGILRRALSHAAPVRLQPGAAHRRRQRVHGRGTGVPAADRRQPRHLDLLRPGPGVGDSRRHPPRDRGAARDCASRSAPGFTTSRPSARSGSSSPSPFSCGPSRSR